MRLSRALVALSLGLASVVLAPCQRDGPRENAGIEEIAAALGRQRLVEPRLTGFDVYAPCTYSKDSKRLIPQAICAPRPRPGTPEFKEVRKAASRLERSARRGPAEDGAQEEAAVAWLVWPGGAKSAEAAVEALENAVERDPKNARLLSDLAAAYYVHAQERDEPQDLVRALDAAARAKNADPDLLEARFNLALALDRLYLSRMAAAAWNEYRELDDVSGWAEEAKQRIGALERPSMPDLWKQRLPELESAALRGDEAEINKLVEGAAQLAREHAMESVLGAWGERQLSGDSQSALRELRIATEIGRALHHVTGDATVLEAVSAIQRAGDNPRVLTDVARGHQAFRDAMKAFRLLRTGEASEHFAEARSAFAGTGSPIELWALCGLARSWGYQGDYAQATQAYGEILSEAKPRGFSSLVGWTYWGLGWVAARQGRLGEALSRTRSMEEAYRRAREAENLAAARFLLGETFSLLGQQRTGWQHIYLALEDLERSPTVFRRHVLLFVAATGARDEGLLEASLLFQEEGLRAAEETRDPLRQTESLWARSRILNALERTDEALADLETAKRIVHLVSQDGPGRKLRADLLWTEGEVWRRLKPERALEPLTAAIREYENLNAPVSAAYASLARARTALTLNRDTEVEAALESALDVLENPATSISEADLRASYFESIQSVYDEMIRFQWDRNKDVQEALRALERARNFRAEPRQNRTLDIALLPEGCVVIEYALLQDRLLTWVIDRERISSFELRVDIAELDLLVEGFVRALQRGDSETEALQISSRLYDALIPENVSALSEAYTVYFIPDKALNKLPFAALLNRKTGRFLVEDHPIAIAPSLMHLLGAQPAPSSVSDESSVLVVGNPSFDRELFDTLQELPGAESELEQALSIFPRSIALSGVEATKKRLLDELDNADVFVFMGHAVVNSSLPSRSYLVLAPSLDPPDSGILLSEEIGEQKLQNVRLVVLAACSSVGPRTARSAGITGLALPFLNAGARTVVGTLWDVEDRETAQLLSSFYRALAEGISSVQALRKVQRESLRTNGRSAKTLRIWSALEVVGL